MERRGSGIHVLASLFLPVGVLAGPFSAENVRSDIGQAPDSPLCLSESCILTAGDLLRQMDRNVDPCQDFYEFACGGYIADTVLPEDKTETGSFPALADKLNQRLRKVFEAESEAGEPKIYEGVRGYYRTCMDTETIEKRSLTDLQKILRRLGGWPVVEGDQWEGEKNFLWSNLSVRSGEEGFSTDRILSIGMSTDPTNSERRILKVDQFSPGLNRQYLIKGFEDKEVRAYYNYMVNMAVLLGAERPRAELEMKEALMLELQLAELALPKEERRNKTALYNPTTLGELQKAYPEVPLVKYINAIMDFPPSDVTESEMVNVAVPSFIPAVRALLTTIPARVQVNYILWRNVKSTVSYLNAEAGDFALQYQKVLTGISQQVPRWERCVESVASDPLLSLAVGAMFVKKYFPHQAKEAANDIVENIRDEFKKMIDDEDWMDPVTRSKALTKLEKIVPYVAYPKEILDDGLIDEFYSGLEMKNDSYLLISLRQRKFINRFNAKEFRKKIDKKDWRTHGSVAVVNAFYDPEENSIQILAGILDGVFFEADRPQYMNFGAIGIVVGHELTHGFDDEGSQRDGDGNLVDWWEPETKKKYLERAQCLIDQYSNYTVEDDGKTINVNGINTQGENIADTGGVKEAYRAYLQYVKEHGPEPVLPALGYSQRQLFWLSGASVWCSVYRPAALKNQVLTDPHSPAVYRVNGPFSNLPQFAEDWNCPVGSPMNPAKKCSVW